MHAETSPIHQGWVRSVALRFSEGSAPEFQAVLQRMFAVTPTTQNLVSITQEIKLAAGNCG